MSEEDFGLGRIGEFALIDRMVSKFATNKSVVIGPGDDAAVVDMPDGDVVVSSDMAVEGVHFRRDWSTPIQIGQRIVAQNLADIAAMGAYPVAITVSIAAPSDLPVSWMEALAVGIAAECAPHKVAVVGGDMSQSPLIVIAVTALGERRGLPVVTRSEASPGDVVAVAGQLGFAAAGLACLQRGHRHPRDVVDRFLVPQPPYEAGPKAAKAGATAMIDVSDGLLADVGHIATASGVVINLESKELVPDKTLVQIARNMGEDAAEWVLRGGEDHALVAVFPKGKRLPAGFRRIGSVTEAAGSQSPESGLTLDGQPLAGRLGHDHFRA